MYIYIYNIYICYPRPPKIYHFDGVMRHARTAAQRGLMILNLFIFCASLDWDDRSYGEGDEDVPDGLGSRCPTCGKDLFLAPHGRWNAARTQCRA